MGYLTTALSLGEEAEKEPRYYRANWPAAFFNKVTHEGQVLRANLNMVEQVLKGANADSLYTDVFEKIRASQSWKAVIDDVIGTLGEALCMVEAVLHNETNLPMPDVLERARKLEGAEQIDDMPALIQVINESGLKYPGADAALTSLEE